MPQFTPKFINVAHRGASSYAPENTFASYDKALAMSVNHVELDVQLTRDDHIVVIHDDTVDRTTDGQGRVADFTLDELRTLDAGGWLAPNTRVSVSDLWARRWNATRAGCTFMSR